MEAVREVTVWTGIDRQPNHDYLLDGDRVLAYRQWGQGAVIPCSGKLKIDRRGRKFVKLDPNPFRDFGKKESLAVEVQGSKGQSYFVNKVEGRCTCPGFQFRGTCKHLKEVQ